MKLLDEFREFLLEYKVIGLAVAFIMGTAATALVTSLVNNIIMPILNPLLSVSGGDWQTATWVLGPVKLSWGPFVASVIDFVIIAFAVFMIAKIVLKEEKVEKK